MATTEFEVKNDNIEVGDYIVYNNPQNLLERYAVKPAKFEKLYHPEPIGVDENGLSLYEAKQTVVRKCLLITEKVVDFMNQVGLDVENVTQAELINFTKWFDLNDCSKVGVVAAHQATKSGELETHVLKSDNPLILNFQQPAHWGEGQMPLKLNDALIVSDDEVYRIAEEEFRRTYNVILNFD